MPQGHRKVPFSNKQKKQQLQEKRDRKRGDSERVDQRRSKSDSQIENSDEIVSTASGGLEDGGHETFDLQSKGAGGFGRDPNRYRLQFVKDSREEIERRRQLAYQPLVSVQEDDLEVSCDEVFIPGSVLDVPKRPPWDYSMSKEGLDAREHRYFREYVQNIEKTFVMDELSYFELNLETWRQLWRVLEISDVLLIIVDIRFPPLLFSPAIYKHVQELKKEAILVLNKIDLAPPPLVAAWKMYFEEQFPGLHVICFTSFFGKKVDANRRRRHHKQKMAADCAKRLLQLCRDIVKDQVDLSSWEEKIEAELHDSGTEDDNIQPDINVTTEELPTTYEEHHRFKDGILSIGCIGYPNVGKSSLLNALMGKKVVSVSRTPGHTKHFQTIFLTPTLKLCDCPGLVFPSKVPKALQVLTGSYPIAQVQEPYSAIRYLAERIPVVKLLKLKHPEQDDGNPGPLQWSPYDICYAWAEKRGFTTAKAARNDTYRAGNHILRQALEGRLCLCLQPPQYSKNKESWKSHSLVDEIHVLLQLKEAEVEQERSNKSEEESESDEEDRFNFGRGSEHDDDSEDSENTSRKGAVGTRNKFAVLQNV